MVVHEQVDDKKQWGSRQDERNLFIAHVSVLYLKILFECSLPSLFAVLLISAPNLEGVALPSSYKGNGLIFLDTTISSVK